MPTPTHKTKIIAAFEQMDLAALRVLLSDDYTYHTCSKDYFLTYFEDAFAMFQRGGDTHLEAVPGKCCSGSCAWRGKKGYMFVGNHTCRYVSFIFEEQDNIPDFTDIHCCGGFGDMPPDVLLGEELNLFFNPSHTPKPPLTPNTKQLNDACVAACADYEQYCAEHPIMNASLLQQWLDRHQKLRKEFNLPPLFWKEQSEFHNLYGWVQGLCATLGREPWAKAFMESFDERLREDDQARYEFLHAREKEVIEVFFSFEEETVKDTYVDFGDMKILRDEFTNYLKVYELALDYWHELMLKYGPNS